MTIEEQKRIPAAFIRGGTSKGLFFLGGALPDEPAERDRVLLRALGGGDPFGSEIDGLGGATSSTSKAVVVSRSARPGFDVDYLFAQVGIDRPEVDWLASCGNLASAVGPFAIDEGLVAATGDETVVRIWQVNTSKEIVAHVPTENGRSKVAGDFFIDGVPHPGAKIQLDFMEPAGSAARGLLPTGDVVDDLTVPGFGTLRASMVDAANPCVFVTAAAVGLTGVEIPAQLNADQPALARLAAVRSAAAIAMGFATDEADARTKPATPRVAFVSGPRGYRTPSGRTVAAEEVDLVVRMMSMGRLHHALPGTGAVAIAVAALLPGTVPNELCRPVRGTLVRIGHSSGVIPAQAEIARSGAAWTVGRATVWRTARRLMDGSVLVPR